MTTTTEQEYNAALTQWDALLRLVGPHGTGPYADQLEALGEAIHEYELTLPEVHALITTETS